MKKLLIFVVIAIFLSSCSSKKVSQSYTLGEDRFLKHIDTYLQGLPVSEVYFLKSVDAFQKRDDFCNLSRLYITKYLLNEEEIDEKSINIAYFYAKNGNCFSEQNLINYHLQKEYDEDKLPTYYKTYIKVVENNNYASLNKKLSKSPDYFLSRILRKTATEILEKDPKLAVSLVEDAHKIDAFNGWTLNLYRDLLILKKGYEMQGMDTETIDVRIENLKVKLHKK
jgi:hypothetical protein